MVTGDECPVCSPLLPFAHQTDHKRNAADQEDKSDYECHKPSIRIFNLRIPAANLCFTETLTNCFRFDPQISLFSISGAIRILDDPVVHILIMSVSNSKYFMVDNTIACVPSVENSTAIIFQFVTLHCYLHRNWTFIDCCPYLGCTFWWNLMVVCKFCCSPYKTVSAIATFI